MNNNHIERLYIYIYRALKLEEAIDCGQRSQTGLTRREPNGFGTGLWTGVPPLLYKMPDVNVYKQEPTNTKTFMEQGSPQAFKTQHKNHHRIKSTTCCKAPLSSIARPNLSGGGAVR